MAIQRGSLDAMLCWTQNHSYHSFLSPRLPDSILPIGSASHYPVLQGSQSESAMLRSLVPFDDMPTI